MATSAACGSVESPGRTESTCARVTTSPAGVGQHPEHLEAAG